MSCTFSVGRSVVKFCKIWTVTVHNFFNINYSLNTAVGTGYHL